MCAAILRFASSPAAETIEYLRRDILHVALRHTANHPRSGALLGYADGTVALAPVYGFAPSFLAPMGIARCSRWPGELEPSAGRPAWGKIAESLSAVLETKPLRRLLAREAAAVERLPETMHQCGVAGSVIARVARRCSEIAEDLRDAEPKG